jgi:hypothetical protein
VSVREWFKEAETQAREVLRDRGFTEEQIEAELNHKVRPEDLWTQPWWGKSDDPGGAEA